MPDITDTTLHQLIKDEQFKLELYEELLSYPKEKREPIYQKRMADWRERYQLIGIVQTMKEQELSTMKTRLQGEI